jgi:hypothetical protein
VPARAAAAALAAKVKRFWFAAKVWKRSHHYIPTSDNNCKFVIDLFDFFEEHRPLSLPEISLYCAAHDALALAVKKRAPHWKQWGKFRAIREGDENTKFFHARASQRLRRNAICTLDCGGVHVIDHAGKADALHAFYHDLLGRARPTAWAFNLGRLYSGASQVDAAVLVGPFNRKEIKVAIWSMDRSSAPGPNGLDPSFYRAA